MSAPPLRLGLVGCGRVAALGYLPALAAAPALRLVAVADPAPDRRLALAAASGAAPSAHDGPEALIAAGGVEALIVAGPAELHLEHARLAAEAGLACLVEKPPAPTLAAARELAALEPRPWIGFNRRFRQGRELAGRVPAAGRLELELELRYRRASWRAHTSRDDALLDLAPHLVDLALGFGGRDGARVRRASCGPERAEVELETERGPALIRCATDRAHLERVAVRTAGARIEIRSGGLVGGALARLARRPHPLVGSLALQLESFAAAARGRDPGPLANAEDGVATMAVIEAARELAAGGTP